MEQVGTGYRECFELSGRVGYHYVYVDIHSSLPKSLEILIPIATF
jgi:hypothetical protein